MTIGEKIIHLRTHFKMSQDDLANKLGVTRQSISKWESDSCLPGLDKAIEIAKLFNVSINDLVDNNVIVNKNDAPGNITNKYFGTDGFRGESNKTLTAERAFKVGRFLGWYFSLPEFKAKKVNEAKPRIVIGKDTRRSSYMIEYALCAGITSSGADAFILHVTTTPSVSYITRMDDFDCGVMITASHNVFYDNGIKVISNDGKKLSDEITSLIESYIDGDLTPLGFSKDVNDIPYASRENIGSVIDYVAGRNRYTGYLISTVYNAFTGLKVGLDCANGSSYLIARNVFNALGAETFAIGIEPDGLNTNKNCGSTHIENLCEFVKEHKLDVGFAFDGDADRCLAVDEKGHVVDGDKIIYLLANRMKRRGILNKDTAVLTIMSNSGAIKAFKKAGINVELTDVGDRFVYERMVEKNYSIGGENSGHIILRKYATTGDGILTALKITEEMLDCKSSLSKLVSAVKDYPQVLKNVRVIDKNAVMNDKDVTNKVEELNKLINENGRILLRKSGTEPVIRIMAELESEEICNKYIDEIYGIIKRNGHLCEN